GNHERGITLGDADALGDKPDDDERDDPCRNVDEGGAGDDGEAQARLLASRRQVRCISDPACEHRRQRNGYRIEGRPEPLGGNVEVIQSVLAPEHHFPDAPEISENIVQAWHEIPNFSHNPGGHVLRLSGAMLYPKKSAMKRS